MLAKNPCAFLVFAFVFTQSSWFWSSFFFSSRFFFLHAFFPKHMHTKKARGAHLRCIQCAAPHGQPPPKISFEKMRGGVLDEFDFFDRLVLSWCWTMLATLGSPLLICLVHAFFPSICLRKIRVHSWSSLLCSHNHLDFDLLFSSLRDFSSCMLFFLSICIRKKPAGPTSAPTSVPLRVAAGSKNLLRKDEGGGSWRLVIFWSF